MKQEDKDLLSKDLCARLPYGVKVKLGDNPNIFDLEYRIKFAVMYGDSDKLEDILDITNIKPYLFSFSSMTEEQKKEYRKICELDTEILSKYPMDGSPFPALYNSQDWLNKNHFDYRGLIPLGLAIDATELNIY